MVYQMFLSELESNFFDFPKTKPGLIYHEDNMDAVGSLCILPT